LSKSHVLGHQEWTVVVCIYPRISSVIRTICIALITDDINISCVYYYSTTSTTAVFYHHVMHQMSHKLTGG